jgi:hypothetical protein
MRTISLNFRAMMNAQETGIVPIVLLAITHPDIAPEIIRFSSDPTVLFQDDPLIYGTRALGQEWFFVPFSLVLPDEREEQAPVQKLVVDNIDRHMVELLRSTSEPAKIRTWIVMSNDVNVIEYEGVEFDLTAASYDAQSIEMTLTLDALTVEPYPAGTFNPAQFPGLF